MSPPHAGAWGRRCPGGSRPSPHSVALDLKGSYPPEERFSSDPDHPPPDTRPTPAPDLGRAPDRVWEPQSPPHLPSHNHPGGPPGSALQHTLSKMEWAALGTGGVVGGAGDGWRGGGRSRGRPARRGGSPCACKTLALARCYTSDSRARARRDGGRGVTAHLGPLPLQARLWGRVPNSPGLSGACSAASPLGCALL